MSTVTYVEIFYPGSFVSKTSTKKVDSRISPDIPENAYAYRFFDQEEVESGGEILKGEPKNKSGTYYLGEEFTADQAMSAPWANPILKDNIKGNGYKRLVRTKFGQVMPLSDNDVVIS